MLDPRVRKKWVSSAKSFIVASSSFSTTLTWVTQRLCSTSVWFSSAKSCQGEKLHLSQRTSIGSSDLNVPVKRGQVSGEPDEEQQPEGHKVWTGLLWE